MLSKVWLWCTSTTTIYAPVTVFVKEHETLTITPPPPTSATKNLVRFYETLTITPPPAPPTSATKNLTRFFVEAPQSLEKIQHTVTRSQAGQRTLIILGAVYGLADVTTTARSFVHDGVFDATANNATWGDSWRGNKKTLVVVYDYAGAVSMVNAVEENEQMHFIASPSLSIHGATYGPAPVTKKVVSLVRNRTLNVVANNDTFGDTWHGHTKSLTITYQYGQERPIVAIAKEGSALNIIYTPGSADYLPPSDPISLNIVGAAYGLGDVTSNVQALVLNNQLDITANNETFGDTWPGTEKSFTLVYQYGRNNPLLEVAIENDVVTVHNKVPPPYFGQVVTKDLLDTGDVTSLSASNNKFIACDTNGKLVAVKDTPDMTTSFTVEKNDDSTVCFKTNAGKYVVVGPDKFLHATGTQSQAARFDISMSTTAGLRLALSETQEYVRLHFDGQGIIVDTVDNFSLNTAFGIAFMSTTASMIMERRGIKEIAALDTLSACEIAWVSFVWQLTGVRWVLLSSWPWSISFPWHCTAWRPCADKEQPYSVGGCTKPCSIAPNNTRCYCYNFRSPCYNRCPVQGRSPLGYLQNND